MKSRETAATVDDLRFELTRALKNVIADLGSAIGIDTAVEQATMVVDSLPFSTVDHLAVRSRLSNAQHYANLGEPGAAKYELQLALHSTFDSGNASSTRAGAYDSEG